MRNKDLIQRAIHSCMDRIGLPYNRPFKVNFNNDEVICRISKGIDGYYELPCFVGSVWIETNEDKLNVLDILFGSAKILKIYEVMEQYGIKSKYDM